MTAVQITALASALLGAGGTVLLFLGTFGFQTLEGAVWGGPEVDKQNAVIKRENRKRARRQKVGLLLLLLSFSVQGIAVFLVG